MLQEATQDPPSRPCTPPPHHLDHSLPLPLDSISPIKIFRVYHLDHSGEEIDSSSSSRIENQPFVPLLSGLPSSGREVISQSQETGSFFLLFSSEPLSLLHQT